MKIESIQTKEDYNAAIVHLESLGDREDFEQQPELMEEFESLASLVRLYEQENYRLDPGLPLEIIKLKTDSLGITQKDFVPSISIGKLAELLHIDQAVLFL